MIFNKQVVVIELVESYEKLKTIESLLPFIRWCMGFFPKPAVNT